jgi:DNA-binding LacI/PurR family transcriptional regulator
VDGAYGVRRAVDHLVARGHRRVAYLGWPPGNGFGDDRRAGWEEAVRRHGLDAGDLVATSAEDVAAAASAAQTLLRLPEPPTAFACGSDTFAVGARIAGGTAPGGWPNLEVVGFDDSPAVMLMSPPMSSVRQPLDEVARRVVELLIDRLRGGEPPEEGVMLRPDLVMREWRGPEPVH